MAQELRDGVREALQGDKLIGEYYTVAKKVGAISTQEIHDRKKKFLSHYEAVWWTSENQPNQKYRVYRCDRCPFFHLTTQGIK